jgi:hypothetical protein
MWLKHTFDGFPICFRSSHRLRRRSQDRPVLKFDTLVHYLAFLRGILRVFLIALLVTYRSHVLGQKYWIRSGATVSDCIWEECICGLAVSFAQARQSHPFLCAMVHTGLFIPAQRTFAPASNAKS